jgi:hypothetical protein
MPNAKGTVMAGLVKAIQAHPERARALLPEKLHKYFDTRVVLAAWYPLDEYLALLRLLIKLAPDAHPAATYYVEVGRASAREQMSGIYGRLKEDRSRKAAATLLSAMYDSGEMKLVERSPGRALLDWVDFPQPCKELCGTFTGYQDERMKLQGMEDVSVRHVKCRAEGAPICRWELRWKSRSKGE